MSSSSPRAARLLLLAVALQLAGAVLLGRAWVAAGASLDRGEWVSTKSTLARGVIGADQFLQGHQAVAGQRLHLGAWHGYQEVVYREALDPVEIRCTVTLYARAHASVLFDRTSAGFRGVRLSVDPARPGMLFRASPEGEFLERTPLDLPPLAPQVAHQVSLRFGPHDVVVWVDGVQRGPFPVSVTVPSQVGFRGGGRMAIVDAVEIRKRGSGAGVQPVATVYGSFAPSPWPATGAVALALLAVTAAVLALRRPSLHEALLATVMGSLTVMVLAAAALVFLSFRAELYPAADAALKQGEQAWRLGEADEIKAGIRRQYAGPPAPGTARVLFLGSSQTWGAGATRLQDTIPAVLERGLNANAPPGRRYQCINGGICAADAALLLGMYETEWLALQPRLTIVDLSNNDYDMDRFRASLRRIAQLGRERAIATLFVLEPNSGEERKPALDELLAHHAVMRQAAEAEQVEVLDMHAWLLGQQDRGFLFWDIVHMTSLGQRLFAERLQPEVERILSAGTGGTGTTGPPSRP